MTGGAKKHAVAPILSRTTAQGRFGEIYVAAVCAQAGYGNDPTSPGEDVRAIDGTIHFDVGGCAYQVKCTTRDFGPKTNVLSWSIEDRWKARWAKAGEPVYFIVVRVKEQENWIQHPADLSTLMEASAYWVRVDINTKKKSLVILSSQRFTADTLHEWAADREEDFKAARAS